MVLYRPVGKAEYELIAQSEFTAYPPRLPQHPIFYPVLNERYAREIAEKRNRRYPDSQYTGYVTTFEIDDTYIAQFPVQTVGASYHQEFWIPAEELKNFNRILWVKSKLYSKNCCNTIPQSACSADSSLYTREPSSPPPLHNKTACTVPTKGLCRQLLFC